MNVRMYIYRYIYIYLYTIRLYTYIRIYLRIVVEIKKWNVDMDTDNVDAQHVDLLTSQSVIRSASF